MALRGLNLDNIMRPVQQGDGAKMMFEALSNMQNPFASMEKETYRRRAQEADIAQQEKENLRLDGARTAERDQAASLAASKADVDKKGRISKLIAGYEAAPDEVGRKQMATLLALEGVTLSGGKSPAPIPGPSALGGGPTGAAPIPGPGITSSPGMAAPNPGPNPDPGMAAPNPGPGITSSPAMAALGGGPTSGPGITSSPAMAAVAAEDALLGKDEAEAVAFEAATMPAAPTGSVSDAGPSDSDIAGLFSKDKWAGLDWAQAQDDAVEKAGKDAQNFVKSEAPVDISSISTSAPAAPVAPTTPGIPGPSAMGAPPPPPEPAPQEELPMVYMLDGKPIATVGASLKDVQSTRAAQARAPYGAAAESGTDFEKEIFRSGAETAGRAAGTGLDVKDSQVETDKILAIRAEMERARIAQEGRVRKGRGGGGGGGGGPATNYRERAADSRDIAISSENYFKTYDRMDAKTQRLVYDDLNGMVNTLQNSKGFTDNATKQKIVKALVSGVATNKDYAQTVEGGTFIAKIQSLFETYTSGSMGDLERERLVEGVRAMQADAQKRLSQTEDDLYRMVDGNEELESIHDAQFGRFRHRDNANSRRRNPSPKISEAEALKAAGVE